MTRIACKFFLAITLSIGASTSVSSQTDAGKDEGQICLAVARGWGGSLAELKAIHENPVPASFSRQYEGGGCMGWQLIKESLVNWHLAYGDETTTRAALAYLEARITAGKPVRSKLSAAVKGDVELAGGYRFMAMEYARSADFFESKALLAKARTYAEPSLEVATALRTPLPNGTPNPLFDDYPDRLWRELDLQLAVAGVRIGGMPEDFAAARAVFTRNDDPNFDDAGKYAYQNGKQFCEIGDNSYLQAWKEACQEGDLEARALTYWRYRAIFSMLALAAGDLGINKVNDHWDGETAIRLIEGHARDVSNGLPELYFSKASFELTDIRFAMAEAKLGKAHNASASGPHPLNSQLEYEVRDGLDLLWQASVYVRGTEHPGWLRRIGRRYQDGSALWDKLRSPEEPVPPEHARRLAWLRTVLPRLDAIAQGEATP